MKSRTKTAVLANIKSSAVYYIVIYALKFLMRMVFLKTLAMEYLGIHGLLTNILAMLSLAELGVGPAIVYSLYKPLAFRNYESVKSIMRLFKRVYIFIGCFIFSLGLLLYPFLDFFIKDSTSIKDLNSFYVVFLMNTSISYFWSYQRNLLIADQKQYLVNTYQMAVQTLVVVLQILTLFISQSYWGYIILMLLGTIVENLIIDKRARREYPYITQNADPIDDEIKRQIIKNASAMIIHKIAGMLVFSTSNLIISKFVGLIAVGLYSNYYMVINALNTLSNKLFEAITASVGHLVLLENDSNKVTTFKLVQFGTAVQASIITVCLFVLLDDFIKLWLGGDYVLDKFTVKCIVILFYMTYMRKSILTFRDACGLFWYDRYKAIAEAILNPIIAVFLTIKYGIVGVILSSILTTIFISLWVEPYVLFRFGIPMKLDTYFLDYLKFSICTLASIVISDAVYAFVKFSFFGLVFGGLVCFIVTMLAWIIAFRKREELIYYRNRFGLFLDRN